VIFTQKFSRIAFANSRASKLLKVSRAQVGKPVGIQTITPEDNLKPHFLTSTIATTPATTTSPDYSDYDAYPDSQDEDEKDEIIIETITTPSTTERVIIEPEQSLPRRKIKIVKRPKSPTPTVSDFKRAGGRRPVLVVPFNSEAQRNLFQIPLEKFKPNEKSQDNEDETNEGQVESAFTSLTILNNRERRPEATVIQPKFVTHPVRLVPITIRNNLTPALQNFHSAS